MDEKSYRMNIHNLVKIKSNFLLPDFEVGKVSDPDIIVKVKKDIDFSKKGLNKLDFWFYGKEGEDFVYFEDNIFGVKNKVLLKNLDRQTEVQVTKSTLRLDRFYPLQARKSFNELINAIIRIKQVEKGYLPIHAACLSKNNSATVLAAFPQVGKTLSTLQLLKEGFKYISNDTVLIDRDGKAYLTSFPSAIFYNDFLKFIKPPNIGTLKYYKTLIKGWLNRISILCRIIKPPLICLGEIFETTKESKVDTVCILERGERRIKEVDKEYMVKKITTINNYSLSRINNPFIWVYSYFNDYSIYKIEEMQREILSKFLDECRCFILACNNRDWISVLKNIEKV